MDLSIGESSIMDQYHVAMLNSVGGPQGQFVVVDEVDPNATVTRLSLVTQCTMNLNFSLFVVIIYMSDIIQGVSKYI
jgi:hypothetical protein